MERNEEILYNLSLIIYNYFGTFINRYKINETQLGDIA